MTKKSIEIIERYPQRSPLCIADHLKHIIKSRVVCELGSRKGDIARLFSQHASKVIGVERNEDFYKEAVEHSKDIANLEFIRQDFLKNGIPDADVYYLHVSPKVISEALKTIKDSQHDCTVICGTTSSYTPSSALTQKIHNYQKNFGGYIIPIELKNSKRARYTVDGVSRYEKIKHPEYNLKYNDLWEMWIVDISQINL